MRKDKNGLCLELGVPYPTEEVGYARVSDGDDQNPAFQIDLMKRRGITDNNIYVDKASGRSMNRPELKKALMLMAGRPGWTLVIWKLDRLGRDATGLMNLADEFRKNEWNLVSMTEQLDTRTPAGKLMFGMMALMAQLESDHTSERTKAGMARLKEQGIKLGRKSTLTHKQWLKVEYDLLETNMYVKDIAAKHGIHPSSVQNHFPKWRTLTKKQRQSYRKVSPLPQD